jgi:excisionase family DNA binding protein
MCERGFEMIANGSVDRSTRSLVSLAVAADRFGISIKTLRRRISDGTVHGYRVGRLIRVDLDELSEHLVVEIPTMR